MDLKNVYRQGMVWADEVVESEEEQERVVGAGVVESEGERERAVGAGVAVGLGGAGVAEAEEHHKLVLAAGRQQVEAHTNCLV